MFVCFWFGLVKVSYLQNDNSLLENKQKELKAMIHSLLQTKETFVNAYEVCVCVPIINACLCISVCVTEQTFCVLISSGT